MSQQGAMKTVIKTASGQTIDINTALQQAYNAHTSGSTEQALEVCRTVLTQQPNQLDTMHLMGIIYNDQRRFADAIPLLSRVIQLKPDFGMAYYNLGNSHYNLGQHAQAVAQYEKAILYSPGIGLAYNNLGLSLRALDRAEEAEKAFKKAVELMPGNSGAQNNLGIIYRRLNNPAEAVKHFRAAIAIDKDHAQAWNNLGATLLLLEDYEEAVKAFNTSVKLRFNGKNLPDKVPLPKHALRHDHEQIEYLAKLGKLDKQYEPYRKSLAELYARIKGQHEGEYTLTPKEVQSIAPMFNEMLYIGDGSRIAGGVLNKALDIKKIEADYNNSRPEITYIDDFLSKEGLAAIRNYCMESTVWKTCYRGGYVGTFLSDGFANPLIIQIARELHDAFPGIFGKHPLVQAWAFKYDSTLNGINIHADFARVNVNFWITPDESCLDKEHGGLVVWDVESPRDWAFKDYNENEEKIRDFLKDNNAKPVRIPYRQNRVVIFNSTLFHETDKFTFKDNYEDRRINVTFLYGQGLREK